MGQPPVDMESLEDKLKRLMVNHNNLATQFQSFAGTLRLIVDSLSIILENEIDDFKAKYEKANLQSRIEATIKARLISHSMGDLNAYAKLGLNLDALKKEAKEKKLQSLYNKTIRRMEKLVEAEKLGEEKANISYKELVNMPDAKVIKIDRKPSAGEVE